MYEGIIAAIRGELAAEERVQESLYYSRDRFGAMEAEVKHLVQVRRGIGLHREWAGRMARWRTHRTCQWQLAACIWCAQA